MEVESAHIPHFEIRTLMEVGFLVGSFALAMGCMACSLNGYKCKCKCGDGCCSRLLVWNCWRKLVRNSDDEEDEESFIDDVDSTRPAPHVFESLNELVFFEAQDEEQGVLAASSEENSGYLIPTSMDNIFPDILGTGEEGDPEANNDLREPLL